MMTDTPWPTPAPADHRAFGLVRCVPADQQRYRKVGSTRPTARGLVDWLCAHGWDLIETCRFDEEPLPTSRALARHGIGEVA